MHAEPTQQERGPEVADQDREQLEYRALSAGAVVSLVLGLLSPTTILAATSGSQAWLMLSPIPLIGLVIGLRSWWVIRQAPAQRTGQRLAAAGATLSCGAL